MAVVTFSIYEKFFPRIIRFDLFEFLFTRTFELAGINSLLLNRTFKFEGLYDFINHRLKMASFIDILRANIYLDKCLTHHKAIAHAEKV